MGIDLSEGFTEEETSELDIEDHIGAFLQIKGGKAAATACTKPESGSSVICPKNYKQ